MAVDFERQAPDRMERARRLLIRYLPGKIDRRLHRLTIRLEVLLHLKLALDEISSSSFAPTVSDLVKRWLAEADRELQTFFRAYPDYGAAVQTSFIADAIRARSRTVIRQLFEATVISGGIRAKAEQQVAMIHEQARAGARKLLTPTRAYLMGRVPMFQTLPMSALEKLADFSRSVVVEAGRTVVRAGEEGHSFFVVTAGLLEVRLPGRIAADGHPRLFAGDYFGEMSLLFSRPRNATIVAVMTTELLELGQSTFEFILKEYPLVRASIYQIAQERESDARSEGALGVKPQ